MAARKEGRQAAKGDLGFWGAALLGAPSREPASRQRREFGGRGDPRRRLPALPPSPSAERPTNSSGGTRRHLTAAKVLGEPPRAPQSRPSAHTCGGRQGGREGVSLEGAGGEVMRSSWPSGWRRVGAPASDAPFQSPPGRGALHFCRLEKCMWLVAGGSGWAGRNVFFFAGEKKVRLVGEQMG